MANMFPLITYDLETCNNYSFDELRGKSKDFRKNTIRLNTLIMEISLLYKKDLNYKPIYTKIKVLFPKRFEDCTSYERDGLGFYFLHQLGRELKSNQSVYEIITESEVISLLREHNQNAHRIDSALRKMLIFIKRYIGTLDLDNDVLKEFTLLGYNNHGFDNLILSNFMSVFYPNYLYQILTNSWDMLEFLFEMKDNASLTPIMQRSFRFIGVPTYDEYGNYIGQKGAYTLSNVYENIFRKKLDGAHDSKFDVIATYQIFRNYFLKYPQLVNSSVQAVEIDLTNDFVSLKN